jgi:hypothetical protein
LVCWFNLFIKLIIRLEILDDSNEELGIRFSEDGVVKLYSRKLKDEVQVIDMESLVQVLSGAELTNEARRRALLLIKQISDSYLEKMKDFNLTKSENVRQEVWDMVNLLNRQEVGLLELISRVIKDELAE